jgi:hypothetical protein
MMFAGDLERITCDITPDTVDNKWLVVLQSGARPQRAVGFPGQGGR